MTIEVFQCNGINGTKDWHVDGPDSSSFYIGTYDKPSKQRLIKAATVKLRQKDLAAWMAGHEIQIRASDLEKTIG